MSPKIPHLRAREVVALLEEKGYRFHHQVGSHAVYRHPDGRRTTIPMHASRTIGVGLLRQILRDADIDPNTLRR